MISHYKILPPWRNRLARSAVNRKDPGSNPGGGELNHSNTVYTLTKFRTMILKKKNFEDHLILLS
jgi:hypothetical protein